MLSRFKAHSHRTKTKAKEKSFFDVCRLFFDFLGCSLIFLLSLQLLVGVNRPLALEQVCYPLVQQHPDFPLTLTRWPMASDHCRRTSDFLSYWPGLASGISKIAEKFKKKKNLIVSFFMRLLICLFLFKEQHFNSYIM